MTYSPSIASMLSAQQFRVMWALVKWVPRVLRANFLRAWRSLLYRGIPAALRSLVRMVLSTTRTIVTTTGSTVSYMYRIMFEINRPFGVLVTVGAILIGSTYVLTRCQHKSIVWFRSRILHKLSQKSQRQPRALRTAFNELPLVNYKDSKFHTHPVSATGRATASNAADRLGLLTGAQPYFIQMSVTDQKRGREGSRRYYWCKDLGADARHETLPSDPMTVLIDVDQYLDMPSFLAANPHPTFIYTAQPSRVSAVQKEYQYTFNKDNEIEYFVHGGGKYRHRVWNYSLDSIHAKKTIFGIPWYVTTYLIERRYLDPDHAMIFLAPLRSWTGLGAILSSLWLSGEQLSRYDVVRGDFLRLMKKTSTDLTVSTGKVGAYLSSTVPVIVDDTIATMARTSKYDITLPQVMTLLETTDRSHAAPLLEFHLAQSGGKPDVICPIEGAVRSYQVYNKQYHPADKDMMKPFMSPIMHGAFSPKQNKGNEEMCVEERINKVAPPEITLTPFLSNVMREFLEQLIPDKDVHTFMPCDHDEVYIRQDRPAQRRILSASEWLKPKRVIQMFMKKETYPNIKPPRPISQINPVDKREYSRFMYALEKLLKRQKWYAFSKSLREVADRVSEICSKAYTVTNSDFSKFDGHGSNLMRELERMVLLRAFHPDYHAEILDLHQAQYQLRGYGAFGTRYATQNSRASGSPETSLFNSLVNAFVAFLAFRMTALEGSFLTPEQAFVKLGIYGGDDGLTADMDSGIYIKAATSIGQDLTAEVINRGKLGVKFLARVYSPDVWTGDTNSCCDVPRQLAKIHVTVTLGVDVTPTMKLLEKVRAFSLSDINTPIIGELCARVNSFGVYGQKQEALRQMMSWTGRFDLDKQYYNIPAQWMEDYVVEAMPDFDRKRFQRWLSESKSILDILNAPMCCPPVVAKSTVAPVVVDGDILLPEVKQGKEAQPEAKSPPPMEQKKKKKKAKKQQAALGDNSGCDHKHVKEKKEDRAISPSNGLGLIQCDAGSRGDSVDAQVAAEYYNFPPVKEIWKKKVAS